MIFSKVITNQKEVLKLVDASFNKKSKICLTYFNQHCFNIYSSDNSYRNLIDTQFYFYLDGIGIYLALKVLKYKNVQKFNASDLNELILLDLISKKHKIFVIGGNFSEKFIIDHATERNINLCGYYNGYFKEDESDEIINKINSSNTQVVIIGMGVPKQEIFASKLSGEVSANLILCVGNFFEFYFGTKKRIPKRFRNTGLEWIYRLSKEPQRLWKRYIIGIPLFMFRILKLYLPVRKKV